MAPITIKYWPIRGRASGIFRMLAEANVEYEHITDMGIVGPSCSLLLSAADEDYINKIIKMKNLAPPIIIDNERGGLTLSQAVPCHMYIGNKYGFNKGIECTELAMQYILDMDDLHSEMAVHATADRKANTICNLQDYLTSDRYKRHLESIDRCIQGLTYFFGGSTPTYVDFALCSYLDTCDGKWLLPLREKTGDTIGKYAPNIRILYETMKNLPSAHKIDHLPLVPPSLVIPPERVAMWK